MILPVRGTKGIYSADTLNLFYNNQKLFAETSVQSSFYGL